MPGQAESKIRNPFPFWLAMHQAVTSVTEEANQSRIPPSVAVLEQKATEKLTEHQTGWVFEGVKQALKQSGYACDTFEQMQSLFSLAGLAISLRETNNSIADYLALCIETTDEMQKDLKSLEGTHGLAGFKPDSEDSYAAY